MEKIIQYSPKILFFDKREDNRHLASRILGAMGATCVSPKNLNELKEKVESQRFSVLILELAGFNFLVEQLPGKLKGTPVIVLSRERLSVIHHRLASSHIFTNFVAMSPEGKFSGQDLLVTVRKILSSDIFGLNKYLNWGAHNMVFHLRNSETRSEYIDVVVDYCNQMNLRQNLTRSVKVFCEELLMNALYDAPRDSEGGQLYEQTPRSSQIILNPLEAARMEVASDGERLAISISDPFGALTRETVLNYFDRCFLGDHLPKEGEKDKAGAGLGLFFCYNVVSHFIINLRPSARTEFIGIFDTGRAQDAKRVSSSFHFFTTNYDAEDFMIPVGASEAEG